MTSKSEGACPYCGSKEAHEYASPSTCVIAWPEPAKTEQAVIACVCGHPRANHADCGTGPCRTNVSLALWHDSNDRKVTACRCRSYRDEEQRRKWAYGAGKDTLNG